MKFSTLRQRVLHEPMVHFVLLGALIFCADSVIASRKENPRVIDLGAEVDTEARTLFRTSLGREPSEQEMTVMRERWVDNEVLYREGLALRVDQGDSTIRERVIFKALNVMQANLALPKIDQAGLQAWYEKNRANYDEPARFDFLEAVMVGDTSEAAVTKFVAALNTGAKDNTESGLRVFKARPRSNLVQSYGEPFAAALQSMPPGHWRALQSKEGLRVVRLEKSSPGDASTFAEVQGKVYQDWKDAAMQSLRTAAVRELGKKYQVRRDAGSGS